MTGAGGSLGRVLVRRLRAHGVQVSGLVRKDRDAEMLTKLGAQAVLGDVREPHSLEELLDGVDLVFHLAAWMGKPFDEGLAREVNVEGTRRLIRSAARAGVERVVLASSVAVYGPEQHGQVSESSPYSSVGDLYSDTKIEAEKVARLEAERLGLELVILQPTMIYGPASPSWTVIPFDTIRKGWPIIIGNGEDLANVVFVEDVALAFELTGFAPSEVAAGESFIIGGQDVTWNTFMGYYATMAGTKLRRLPAAVARAAAAASGVTRLIGKRPQVVPEMVGVMTSRTTFSSDKAKNAFGYVPQIPLAEGMRQIEAWLRSVGRVRRPSVAIVTGAASGLGRQVALGLKGRGVTVWATDLGTDALEDLAAQGIHTVELDVTKPESVERALATVSAVNGPPDLLVNVAGLAKPGALEVQTWRDVELQFEVNAFGPLRLARAVAPGMRERGYGRIVNVSSTNGFVVTPFMGAYSASKYALEAISDALRLELAPWGVEVVVIEPGAMKTPFAERAQESLRRAADTSGEWGTYLKAFQNSAMWGTNNATDPAKIAALIVNTVFARRARPRVLATLDALPSKAISLLPARFRDVLFRRLSGLHRAPSEISAASSETATSPLPAPEEKTGSR